MTATLTTAIITTALLLIRRADGSIEVNPDDRTGWEYGPIDEAALIEMLEAGLVDTTPIISGAQVVNGYRITSELVELLDEEGELSAQDALDIEDGRVEVIEVD